MSTTSYIRKFVFMLPKGQIFTTRELLRYGRRAAVDTVLFRLVQGEIIRRLARGVFIRNDYCLPDPPLDEIVRAKVQAFGRRMVRHGSRAAADLGLAPPPQQEHIYAIDGRTSSFKIGDLVIHLKGVAPRKIEVGDSKAGHAIRALWHLGRLACDGRTAAAARYSFLRPDREELPRHARSMPGWMADLFNWQKVWEPPRWADPRQMPIVT